MLHSAPLLTHATTIHEGATTHHRLIAALGILRDWALQAEAVWPGVRRGTEGEVAPPRLSARRP